MSRLAQVVRLVDPGDGASPHSESGKSGPDDCREDELATRHFFFFLDLAAGFGLALLAGFFAVVFLAALEFPPLAALPNAFSQFSQKAGVVPVRTIGPPMV
jgi:hypothetical protein